MAALQIVSGSRDKTIKLWNTIGECKYTIAEPDGHTEWVSCVRFSPVTNNPIIVSAGWDKLVKVSSQNACLTSQAPWLRPNTVSLHELTNQAEVHVILKWCTPGVY